MFGLYSERFNVFAGVAVKCFINHSKEEFNNLTFSFNSATKTSNHFVTVQCSYTNHIKPESIDVA
jgi:hypothetical protein